MAEEKITRTYTVPLRRGFNETPRYKRTNKAVRVLREFLVKHMKSENIRLGDKLNELIWTKGIKNPPPRVKITVTKDKEGIVRAELEGTEYKDFKQQDKKEEPKSAKEKLQSAVKGAKGDKKETKEEAETKVESKPVTPVKKEAPKTPAKPVAEKTEDKV